MARFFLVVFHLWRPGVKCQVKRGEAGWSGRHLPVGRNVKMSINLPFSNYRCQKMSLLWFKNKEIMSKLQNRIKENQQKKQEKEEKMRQLIESSKPNLEALEIRAKAIDRPTKASVCIFILLCFSLSVSYCVFPCHTACDGEKERMLKNSNSKIYVLSDLLHPHYRYHTFLV